MVLVEITVILTNALPVELPDVKRSFSIGRQTAIVLLGVLVTAGIAFSSGAVVAQEGTEMVTDDTSLGLHVTGTMTADEGASGENETQTEAEDDGPVAEENETESPTKASGGGEDEDTGTATGEGGASGGGGPGFGVVIALIAVMTGILAIAHRDG